MEKYKKPKLDIFEFDSDNIMNDTIISGATVEADGMGRDPDDPNPGGNPDIPPF